MKVVTETSIDAYPLIARGKVRDIYEIDERTLLMVTTDRMSAFDVVLSEPVPYKGVVLNQLTLFWARKFEPYVPNAILEWDVSNYPAALKPWLDELEMRSMIVRKASPLPIECIARGYITGSGWKSYQKAGEICGQKLPAGLEEASRLDPPLFTPTTKASIGNHDENITYQEAAALAGDAAAEQARSLTLELYMAGSAYARSRGIIIADTKFEFGFIGDELHIIDEILTPDSSRFWPDKGYQPGRAQPSFDKQYLRDWLARQDWDRKPPAPHIPEEVISDTRNKYFEAYESLTGQRLACDDRK